MAEHNVTIRDGGLRDNRAIVDNVGSLHTSICYPNANTGLCEKEAFNA